MKKYLWLLLFFYTISQKMLIKSKGTLVFTATSDSTLTTFSDNSSTASGVQACSGTFLGFVAASAENIRKAAVSKVAILQIVDNSTAKVVQDAQFQVKGLPTEAKSFQICNQGALAVDAEDGNIVNPYVIAFDKVTLAEKWQAKVNLHANAHAVRFDKNGNIYILSKLIDQNVLVVSGFDKDGNILTSFADNGNLFIEVPNYEAGTISSMRIIEDIFVGNVDSGSPNDNVHVYKISLVGEILDHRMIEYKEISDIRNAKICKSFFFGKLNVSANGFDSNGIPKLSNVRLNFDLSIDTTYSQDGFGTLNDFLDSPSSLHDGFGHGFVHLVSDGVGNSITYSAINENGEATKEVSETGNIQLPGENMKVAAIYHDRVLGADIVTATQNPGAPDAKLFIYTITYPSLQRSPIVAAAFQKYCNLSECGI